MEPPAPAPALAPAPQEKPAHVDNQPRRSKKEDRQHKKDDKAVEQFLKSLNGIQNPEEKVSTISKKYAEIAEENRRLQAFIKQSDKRFAAVTKEKEQLQQEYNRTVLVKAKLETLCRELQKQNKCIKDESMLKIREEEERRKETQAKFQSTLTEITSLLQQNNDKNSKLREDNISMTTKFKSVVEQYQLREQQVEKISKQMSLEQQLSEAKLAKASLEAQAERERLLADMAQLKLELSQCHARIVENKGTEASLRSQIAVYTDKYDEFQNALVKSNQVFGGFKGEMEKMSKKIIKLEKESLSWKKRWENSQGALLEMATDKRLWDERCAASDRQVAQLQRLCRTMQSERTLLLNTLKEHNIERPPLPVLPPAPPAPPVQPSAPSKVDAMAANCAQLKQSLAQLQNQLNVLTTKKEEESQAKTEQPPPTKSKKSKGKKNKADKEKALQTSVEPAEIETNDLKIETNVPKIENLEVSNEISESIETTENNVNLEANIVENRERENSNNAAETVQEEIVENKEQNDAEVQNIARENIADEVRASEGIDLTSNGAELISNGTQAVTDEVVLNGNANIEFIVATEPIEPHKDIKDSALDLPKVEKTDEVIAVDVNTTIDIKS